MLFLDITSTATDNDAAMNIVRITSNDGNSAIVGVGSGVPVVVVREVDGLGVGDEPKVDDVELGVGVGFCVGIGDGLLFPAIGLGVGVGFCVGVGDGLLLLAEL